MQCHFLHLVYYTFAKSIKKYCLTIIEHFEGNLFRAFSDRGHYFRLSLDTAIYASLANMMIYGAILIRLASQNIANAHAQLPTLKYMSNYFTNYKLIRQQIRHFSSYYTELFHYHNKGFPHWWIRTSHNYYLQASSRLLPLLSFRYYISAAL